MLALFSLHPHNNLDVLIPLSFLSQHTTLSYSFQLPETCISERILEMAFSQSAVTLSDHGFVSHRDGTRLGELG
jgi:hypothetical protein